MPKKLVTGRLQMCGSWGLNSQRQADILPAAWATVADNCVFDDSGRLASRKGSQNKNATTISGTPDVGSIHEYIDGSGSKLEIIAAGNVIYKVDGDTLIDISGTITTPTGDNWKFQNFNGKCVGFQEGHTPIVISIVTGSFTDITLSGTEQPTTAANEILAAYGRLWTLDGTDLKYSDALNESAWNGAFDLSTIWLNGMDVGVALAEFNGYLIIFGKQSIAVYNNPWSPTGGGTLSTANMTLVENIGNIGCIARDSVQYIGTDILFLSYQGVRSLGRTIQEKSMPVNDISNNVNDALLNLVQSEGLDGIKSAYSKAEGFYIITLPTSDKTYYFDVRRPLQDGSYRVTRWNNSFSSLFVTSNDTLYLGVAGYLATYTGYLDNKLSDGTGGIGYSMEYISGWNNLSEVNPEITTLQKLPKTSSYLILGGAGQTASIKWAFDFEDTFFSFNRDIPSTGVSEWGVAQYGIDEYSGGLIYNTVRAPMRKTGQVLKVGFSTFVEGSAVALQFLDINMKLGRIAA